MKPKGKSTATLECPPQKVRCIRNQLSALPRNGIIFTAETRTKQSFRDECNINNIMAKYQKTGIVEHANRHQPTYGTIPAVDFHQAVNLIMEAEATFGELPAVVRRRFENDPAQFLAFCENPANYDEAGTLGLLNLVESPPEPTPEPAPGPSSAPAE